MTFLVTFMVLSILGILDAGYLIYQHKSGKPLVCPMNHNCSVVTESRWAHLFGIRTETLGMLFYVGMLCAVLVIVKAPSLVSDPFWYLMLATIVGFCFSLFFVGLQLFVIKDYCFYCMLSAIINTLLLINGVYLYVHPATIPHVSL